MQHKHKHNRDIWQSVWNDKLSLRLFIRERYASDMRKGSYLLELK